MSQTTAVDSFLQAICAATIDSCDVWGPDATLDATVPNWRYRRSGADAIRETYAPGSPTPASSSTCAGNRPRPARSLSTT